MSVEQTRPYELGLYDGSEDSSTVMVTVDKSTWDKPKRYALSNFGEVSGSSVHVEKDRLTGLSSHSVSVEFDSAFDTVPVGDVQVYRMVEIVSGKWRKEEVLWGFDDANQPSLLGFDLTIDSEEDLSGIIIQYLYH